MEFAGDAESGDDEDDREDDEERDEDEGAPAGAEAEAAREDGGGFSMGEWGELRLGGVGLAEGHGEGSGGEKGGLGDG